MPELPEVQTVAGELNQKLRGRTIASVEVRAPKLISVGPHTVGNRRSVSEHDVRAFRKLLTGQRVLSVTRRAKLIIFDLSGPLSLLVHLKMTGQFIFEDEKLRKKTGGRYRLLNKLTAPLTALPSKHTHVTFRFKGGATLYYNDFRKFGYLKVVPDDEIGQVHELKEFGPEPLARSFTFEVFDKAVSRRPKGKIKQVLMDPKVVAGIGNIYSDEILFHAKVRPTRSVASLSAGERKAIFKSIGPVLKKGIAAKGSSVGDFVRTDGSWGGMGKYHFVYGRRGKPCKRCGTTVESVKLGGRTGSYCPRCQK